MKTIKTLFTFILVGLFSSFAFGQVPQAFKYQSVVRDASGVPLASTAISVRATIHNSSAAGIVAYQETFTVTTNTLGLINLEIGNGTPVTGTFASIAWGTGTKWMAIEADFGSGYVAMGSSQLLSVPFALYALNGVSSATAWETVGNTGTSATTNFIGTTDSTALAFKVNNNKAGLIGLNGTTFLGYTAGNSNRGNDNSGVGSGALYTNISGTKNTAFGTEVLYSNTADANTGMGYQALYSNTTGSGNVANGYQSLHSNTTGNANSANGKDALAFNTTGSNNVANGVEALTSNTTGNFNTANGAYSLHENTSGLDNTATGSNSLYYNTTGSYNTANGYNALITNTTGNYNNAIGMDALYYNTTGNQNSACGIFALYKNNIGNDNTASGYGSLYANTSGNHNTGIGKLAGNAITTGSNNTAIGHNAQVPSATADNQVMVGDTNITYAGVQVAWTITSDSRLKSDIKESNLGLNFINKLKPVSYIRNNDSSKKREYGFIAQGIEEALNESGAADNGIIKIDDKGMYSVRYNDLIAPLVKAVQEQQQQIESLKTEIAKLKK